MKVTFDSGHNVEKLSACFGGRGAMSISSLKNLWLCFDYERRRVRDDTQTYIQYCTADLYELLE